MGFPAHQPVTSLRPMGLSTGRVLPPVAPALDSVTECVEIDNRYPSLTQTKHAYNQQCGRSTGARTRTEPAFWALLSARPADVADDGLSAGQWLIDQGFASSLHTRGRN